MTHLCYTLDEAAEKLNLSETVLVRLSQYFKVPKSAYEEMGYLSFKGDLTFSDQDLAFFRQVKERLLVGESLEDVKSRIRRDDTLVMPSRVESAPQPSVSYRVQDLSDTPVWQQDEGPASAPEPLREVEDRRPYQQAAQKSFERYKSTHRSGLSRIFENMMKEVGSTGLASKAASMPGPKPMRAKAAESEKMSSSPSQAWAESLERSEPPKADKPVAAKPVRRLKGQPVIKVRDAKDAEWERLVQSSLDQPRVLNTHLKNAAALLRDRALGASSTPSSGLSSQSKPLR